MRLTMTHKAKTQLRSLALNLVLGIAGLAVTACGPRYAHHATNSAACSSAAYVQACDYTDYQYGYYVIPTYYVQTPPAVTYAPIPPAPIAPDPIPLSVPLDPPLQTYEPAPIITQPEPAPPPSWIAKPVDDMICPEGTIQAYGGKSCLQVAVPRK